MIRFESCHYWVETNVDRLIRITRLNPMFSKDIRVMVQLLRGLLVMSLGYHLGVFDDRF